MVECIVDLAFLACDEILHIQLRLRPFTADKGNLLAIGRRRRAHRPTRAGYHRLGLSGVDLVTLDIENFAVGILRIFENRSRRDVARVIDMLAIRREDRFAEFLLVLFIRLLDQHDAAAT